MDLLASDPGFVADPRRGGRPLAGALARAIAPRPGARCAGSALPSRLNNERPHEALELIFVGEPVGVVETEEGDWLVRYAAVSGAGSTPVRCEGPGLWI